MPVLARPDLLYAVRGYLRSHAELAALVGSAGGWKQPAVRSGPRISSEIQGGSDGWKMPTRAIIVRKAGGPVDEEGYAQGITLTRLDTFSYGATGAEADEVWRLLDAILVPTDGRPASFDWQGVAIGNIVPEAGEAMLVDPEAEWRYVFRPYVVLWRTG